MSLACGGKIDRSDAAANNNAGGTDNSNSDLAAPGSSGGTSSGAGGDKNGAPNSTVLPPSSSSSGLTGSGEPTAPYATDGSWGTWQLLSLDTPSGKNYAPPFVEVELDPSGKAYRWTCGAASTGSGEPCPFNSRTECTVGTMTLSGVVWHVDLDNSAGSSIGSANVVEEASGDITLDGTGILEARAHYHRVAAPGNGCIPDQ